MLALFSLILVLVGCANWLCIGLLQFDFVAGIFGSQSNIFSRIIYVIVGIAAIVLTVNIIKNKGKIGFNFKKLSLKKEPKPATQTEHSSDFSKDNSSTYKNTEIRTQTTQNTPHNPTHMQSTEKNQSLKSISQTLSNRHNHNNNITK